MAIGTCLFEFILCVAYVGAPTYQRRVAIINDRSWASLLDITVLKRAHDQLLCMYMYIRTVW